MDSLKLFTFFLFFISAQVTFAANKPIKVVVIDTGLQTSKYSQANLCESEHLDLTGEGFGDTSGHGTNVTGLIVNNAGNPANYCIVIIKAFATKSRIRYSYLSAALAYAANIKADVVNLSGGGYGMLPEEQYAVKKLLQSGAIFVVAAGNEAKNLNIRCNYFPACYDQRIVVVGATEKFANYGTLVDFKVSGKNLLGFGLTMSGTSQATAVITGRIIKGLAK